MKYGLTSCVAVVAAVALTAAGCSSNEQSSDSAEPQGTATQSAKPSVLRIKDKGVVAKGGTVHVIQTYDYDSLDPTQ